MLINSARFITSSPSVDKAPDTDKHEYAFIGRSNVGKSSLINMLTGKKALAKTSATPGKTMLINHFLVNDSWYIVDLPGYGFAQRSKKELAGIDQMIRNYILYRPQMTNLFLLIDSRHEPQKIDMAFMEWLADNEVPFSIVFTKLDKMSKTRGAKNVSEYCARLLETWEELPPIFTTSAIDGTGRDQLLDYIDQLNKLPLNSSESSDYSEPSDFSEPTITPTSELTAENIVVNTNDNIMEEKKNISVEEALRDLPGAAIDNADDNKVTPDEIKQRTDVLDCNPRSEE